MKYSLDSITDNCYDGTTCLINKFDIRDEEQLERLESHAIWGRAICRRTFFGTVLNS